MTSKKQNKEMLDRLQYGFSVQKIIYKGWGEYERAIKKWADDVNKRTGFKLKKMFGKYQYILRSERGEISIIQIKKIDFSKGVIKGKYGKERWAWEMFAFENPNLFRDTIQCFTKKEAFEKAKKYLIS